MTDKALNLFEREIDSSLIAFDCCCQINFSDRNCPSHCERQAENKNKVEVNLCEPFDCNIKQNLKG